MELYFNGKYGRVFVDTGVVDGLFQAESKEELAANSLVLSKCVGMDSLNDLSLEPTFVLRRI